jgi:hypothetical protein
MVDRLTGVVGGGVVNNVTDKNRYEVISSSPTIIISLLAEDESTVIGSAVIPNTRERPDVVLVEGSPYMALDTRANPPQYMACMYLSATTQEKG